MAAGTADSAAAAAAVTEGQGARQAGPKDPGRKAPMPLSAFQESEVRKVYHKRVRDKCADEIREFAECARNRTVTATWLCRDKRLAMNACMLAHASPDEEDRAREQWFAEKEERRRQREQEQRDVERRRAEVVRMMREDEARRREEEEREARRREGWFGWARR